MRKRSRTRSPAMALCATLAASLFAIAPPVFSDAAVWLVGPVSRTEISGTVGSMFTLGLPEGTHGIYGLWSLELKDKPCFISTMSENINDFQDDSDGTENFCGANATSDEMKVEFGDVHFPQRTFVRALRVCTNKGNTQVKGLQIHGSVIDANGKVSSLPARHADSSGSSGSSGTSSLADLNSPVGLRLGCDSWQKWVECPQGGIATAITAHFGPGPEPRSLTGIALQCRAIGNTADQK